MSDKFDAIERLLGLPPGSTSQSEEKIGATLANGVKNKTKELVEKSHELEVLGSLPSSELVKSGFDIAELEQDKVRIKSEAFEVYEISKALLDGFKTQLDGLVNPSDRMWTAGAKLIDSVTGSLDRLTNMILKFKQEEEMKGLTIVGENEQTSKPMTPQDWIAYIKEVKDSEEIDSITANKPPKDSEEIIEQ
jgi:hypothetical protein